MTQDEIIEMLKESDLDFLLGDNWMLHHELEHFAKLVVFKVMAQPERSAPCAKHCEATAFQITIKNLEAQLAQRTWVGLTDEKICLIAHNTDPNDWDDLTFKKCWYEGFKAGFREAEIEHNIKG